MRIYQTLVTAFIVMLSVVSTSFAQQKAIVKLPVDEETKLFTYDKVQEVAGVSQAELYSRGLEWCLGYFKNPNDVIRERDSVGGKILCKARFNISNPADKKGLQTSAGMVQYTLTLMFKEGKYRAVLTEINWKQQSYYAIERWMDTSSQYYDEEKFNYYLQQTDEKAKEILKDLDKTMKTGEKVKSSDW